jgi:pSer/pThr/pTyr-binding forkhead associated (FHA) protein
MSVELVAMNGAESLSAEAFPAIVGQKAGSVQVSDAVPGSYHCLVSLVESQLVVWDLGTAGGTFVNGAPVSKASIKSGDTLKLGGTEFKVNYKPRSNRYMFGVRS